MALLLLGISAVLVFNAWPSHSPSRVLLLGVDGADWRVIDPLLQRGSLPNIRRLMENGVYGPLQTIAPAMSPVVWTTIATGKYPAFHGIKGFFFLEKKESQEIQRHWSSNMVNSSRLWNILGDAGIPVGVVGWWITYPAEKVNGFMVSDHFFLNRFRAAGEYGKVTPREMARMVYPPELTEEALSCLYKPGDIRKEDLEQFFELTREEFEILREAPYTGSAWKGTGKRIVELKFAYQSDLSTIAIAEKLYPKVHPQFLAVYLNGIDPAEHFFWKFSHPEDFNLSPEDPLVRRYGSVIDRYYLFTDKLIGRLVDLFGGLEESTVLLCSDHGMDSMPVEINEVSGSHMLRNAATGTYLPPPPGVFILSGKNVHKGQRVTGVDVHDITPLILYSMGQAVGDDMGRVSEEKKHPVQVHTQFFLPSFSRKRDVITVDSLDRDFSRDLTPQESPLERELLEKMRHLGYIE